MALPKTIEARLFYQAAIQRFDDAQFLLDKGGRTTAAVYLAGYSEESVAFLQAAETIIRWADGRI